MKTFINSALVVETEGFDVAASLEQSGDKGMADWFREETMKYEEQAKSFLSTKERQKFYEFSGRTVDEFSDYEGSFLLPYTDEEKARMEQLIIDTYNADEEVKLNSVQEICKECALDELQGLNNELDELLLNPVAEKVGMYVYEADLEQVHFLYRMTCRGYNERRGMMMDPVGFRVELTDDEYVFLLSRLLMDRYGFNFNRLLLINPALAQKIASRAEDASRNIFGHTVPTLIQLDEIREDAEAIAGPEPICCQLFEETRNEDYYHIVVNTEGRSMEIFQELWNDGPVEPMKKLEGISGDAVMKQLEVKNYFDMMDKLIDLFSCSTGYEDIKKFLDESGIEYTEKIGY